MSAFNGSVSQFEALGVKLVGVNIDHKFAQKAFAEKLGLQFSCIEDPNRVISTGLGTLLAEVAGTKNVNYRGALIVDKSGTLRWQTGSDAATLPDVAEVLAQVRKIVA